MDDDEFLYPFPFLCGAVAAIGGGLLAAGLCHDAETNAAVGVGVGVLCGLALGCAVFFGWLAVGRMLKEADGDD